MPTARDILIRLLKVKLADSILNGQTPSIAVDEYYKEVKRSHDSVREILRRENQAAEQAANDAIKRWFPD